LQAIKSTDRADLCRWYRTNHCSWYYRNSWEHQNAQNCTQLCRALPT